MAVFLVDIDLRVPGHDYGALWRALKAGEAQPLMNASFLVDVNQDLKALTTAILSHCAKGDGVFIVELAPETRWSGTALNDDARAWLAARMTSAQHRTAHETRNQVN